jgi:uncharacterized repeat protein (TIGR03803 family)
LPDSLVLWNGALFGTTELGGIDDYGTFFEVTKSGAERTIYQFRGGTDGIAPQKLVVYNGALYGITANTFFEMSARGVHRILHVFGQVKGDGSEVLGAPIVVNGKFYGTSDFGGANNFGTVYEIDTAGKERVLYSFRAAPTAPGL